RRNDGAGNAALDRAERGESSAAESLLLVLHKIENRGIAADSRDGAKRAEIQALDVRAAYEFRVYVSDGHEELVRGSHIKGLDLRAFRTIAGIGSDSTVFNFMQNEQQGLGGTALATFGSVEGG